MNFGFDKRCLLIVFLAGSLFSVPVHAAPSCTKKMLKTLTSASDQCLSEQMADLNAKIDKRYAEIVQKLPDVATPPTDTEYEGISKQRMNDLQASWRSYQEKACAVDASRYGLQKRYDDRARSACWINAAKQHLIFLR
jgi:Lysozyme inhibitor LprI